MSTFEIYLKEYLTYDETCHGTKISSWIPNGTMNVLFYYIKDGIYERVPFEIRFGFFKFVCEKLKHNFQEVYNQMYWNMDLAQYQDVSFILPLEFLNTLLNETKNNQ